MAPWSNRNGSQPAADLVSRPQNSSLDASSPRANLSRRLGTLDTSRVQADSSSSDSDLHPSRPRERPRRPQHSRSMSHPFPSLFSGKKKKQESSENAPADSDSSGAGRPMTKHSNKSHKHSHGIGPGGSKDFATGNCMTCGSLVRWPKELTVFRCTICLTINDLVPRDGADNGDITYQGPSGTNGRDIHSSPHPSNGRPKSISIPYTRQLIHQCLQTFLTSQSRRAALREESKKRDDSFPRDIESCKTTEPFLGWKVFSDQSSTPTAGRLFDSPPTLRSTSLRGNPGSRSYSASYPDRPSLRQIIGETNDRASHPTVTLDGEAKRIFKPLEDYVVACLTSFHCVNSSFSTCPEMTPLRSGSESQKRRPSIQPRDVLQVSSPICDLDPKLLLLGDFAENGTWWTGGQDGIRPPRMPTPKDDSSDFQVSQRSPFVDWDAARHWFGAIINAAEDWRSLYDELKLKGLPEPFSDTQLRNLEYQLLQGQEHTQRVLLKATELLLKRPGRPISEPADMRFLLIALENPLIHGNVHPFKGWLQPHPGKQEKDGAPSHPRSGPQSGHHSGLIKRILGLISNSKFECQNHLIEWFARYNKLHFLRTEQLASGFLTYRLLRQNEKKRETKVDVTAGLIPTITDGHSAATLHAALGTAGSSSRQRKEKKIIYSDDWQIKAAARVMALLFIANNLPTVRRETRTQPLDVVNPHRDGVHAQGQIIATSDFYNSLVDSADLVADFESWESKRGKFAFCQYPFLLSIWAKTQILEHDARRQMQNMARDAFFDSIMSRKNVNQFLVLDVRRDCLVEDSLKAVSEIIGSGSEDIKKRLRIVFRGEEGVDHGGLRKEWFHLLVREVFNPEHGMFVYDEDSQHCYFNPNSFETSDQFFLVGVVMGLAIYNSTILDVALPPFAFRKLLAAAPAPAAGSPTHARLPVTYALEDLAEYRPRLARGLRQLLDYEGDVESTFSLDFVVDTEKYGAIVQVPLCPGGERQAVNNNNRREYVDLYVRYVLDTAVARQFEPFKRGFYTVCGGSALSLFRPEEIELLIRGSDETLDIASLRAVAVYDNWGSKRPDGLEPTVGWFWDTFADATPTEQRKLLLFITGSDRIPATGAALLPIKIVCLGEDCGRFPIARTCFNLLALWKYPTRKRLESMLWTAVHESEGFGLK